MSFPEYTFFGNPKGWQDRGEIASLADKENFISIQICSECKNRTRIGIDSDGSRFKFCRVCLIKLSDENK